MNALADNPVAARIWADLLAGNERFRAGRPQARDLAAERQAVVQSQSPKAVVLACSDSRVSPEIIFDQRLGDLFVVRIAGNVIDKLAIGSIEYAVEMLGVCVLVVVGHQSCGAVTAALAPSAPATPNLKAIIKAIRISASSPPAELSEAVKENVRYVARAVLDRSDLLHDRAGRGEFTVVGAYYSFDTGAVIGL